VRVAVHAPTSNARSTAEFLVSAAIVIKMTSHPALAASRRAGAEQGGGRTTMKAGQERAEERFGRYKIRGVLGQGGMGRLYLAEQMGIEGFTKIVALKRILPHLADNPHFRDLFLNEARVAARLEHPNIVLTYELGEVDGTYFTSMEYLPGEDLGVILRRCGEARPMPLELAAHLAQQCANGLHYAHEARDAGGRPGRLVHRDVNPSNIIVTYFGMVKLLDFGIVKVPSGNQTVPGSFKGKYAYAAPEQIEGAAVDRSTDTFCLGIVLWECLTGRRLFEANTDVAMLEAVRKRPIPPPSQHRREIPPELDAVALKALSRDRVGRYQTAHELSEALDRFLTRREERASAKSVGQWMTTLFGLERASLKKSIAQGIEVESALERLSALGSSTPRGTGEPREESKSRPRAQPRALWSTSVGARAAPGPLAKRRDPIDPAVPTTRTEPGSRSYDSAPTPILGVTTTVDGAPREMTAAPAPKPRRRRLVAGMVGGAVALTAAVFFARGAGPSGRPGVALRAASATIGALDLKSEPAGAHVFVDGEPSGLMTPTVLSGLRAGRSYEIRLDKAGFTPAVARLEVPAGPARAHAFKLVEASGTVRLAGLPAGAAVFVDEARVDAKKPLRLSTGAHKIRVEANDDVLFSATVDVKPGAQTLQIRGAQPIP
jgi:serine/threonine protein kinase